MGKIGYCRQCDIRFEQPEDNKIYTCDTCGEQMSMVTNPVSLLILDLYNPQVKEVVEKILFQEFRAYRIKKGVVQVLQVIPTKVFETIGLKAALNIGARLQKAGASISIISEVDGREYPLSHTDLQEQEKSENKPEPAGSLPAKDISPPDEPKADSAAKYNILVVEDSLVQRNNICNMLSSIEGARIVQAANGVEAIVELSRTNFELVLTDITMPHMDGLKLVEYMRSQETTKKTPVLFLTARATPNYVQHAISLDIKGYILKPAKASDIKKQVLAALS